MALRIVRGYQHGLWRPYGKQADSVMLSDCIPVIIMICNFFHDGDNIFKQENSAEINRIGEMEFITQKDVEREPSNSLWGHLLFYCFLHYYPHLFLFFSTSGILFTFLSVTRPPLFQKMSYLSSQQCTGNQPQIFLNHQHLLLSNMCPSVY